MAPAAYYGLAGEIVNTIRPQTEADPVGVLVHVLSFFGNAVGRSPYCFADGSEHHTNIFAVFVGKTFSGRKGTAAAQARRIFRQVDPEWEAHRIQGGLASGEGLIYAVRDPIRKPEKVKGGDGAIEDVIVDRGVEDKRLFCIESEFSATLRVMRRESNILSQQIRKAWDDGSLQNLSKKDPNRATNAHISIAAHIPDEELHREMDSIEAANGFGNRFLWFCVKRSQSLPEGGKLSDADLQPFAKRMEFAIDNARRLNLVERDDDARALWAGNYEDLTRGSVGMWGALTARGAPLVLRLSLIYALLDNSRQIRPEHLLAALALWDYSAASVKYLFGHSTGDANADKVLKALKDTPSGSMTQVEILDSVFARNISSKALGSVRGFLERLQRIETKEIETGGRPAILWSLK